MNNRRNHSIPLPPVTVAERVADWWAVWGAHIKDALGLAALLLVLCAVASMLSLVIGPA